MIDPLLTLSFNLQAQRGTYALLIGSGVSRSAGIPTGWEVTLDLVNQLAHLEDRNFKGDAIKWYEEKHSKAPDYSTVLPAIASTQAAQQKLLKKYFEPTAEERVEGKKLPTEAHHAIADLVSKGYIKVIITTNFDRLIESALEAKGIPPVVIASSDAAVGAPPLAHSACTIIKVHGDYLDHRIKNSEVALSNYDETMKRLLAQVFDEYGLIISGWSSDYDLALREALERSKTRRYPMYWTGISAPSGTATSLINLHNAHFLQIEGANKFFPTLLEKISALEEFNRPHPISTQAAVVSLKRYLSEDKYRIQLRDLLMNEAKKARETVDASFEQVINKAVDQQSTSNLMKKIESDCETLIHLFANGSFYCRPEYAKSFFDAFEFIATIRNYSLSGFTVWINMRSYPALLLAYAAGISAVASENFTALRDIAYRVSSFKGEKTSLAAPAHISAPSIMEASTGRQLIPGMQRRHTPVSDYIFDILREPLHTLIPDDEQYSRIFDNFEYLWCLLNVDVIPKDGHNTCWIPYGAFCRRRRDSSESWFKSQAQNAVDKVDNSWPPLRDGLFGGSIERLSNAIKTSQPELNTISDLMRW